MSDAETIKEKLDITDIISEYVPLKRAGRNLKALCPFHTEKTPSFMVSPDRGAWHCFGCGLGGDVFSFVMKIDNLEFPEALKMLAQKAGITLTASFESGEKTKIKQKVLNVNELTAEYYHYLLTRHSLGEAARNYLKKRRIDEKLIKTFKLGYAPNAWDSLSKYLISRKYTPADLKTAGLTAGRGYDRFRGRIIFPLNNHRGETVGFSGRLISPSAKEAKYINSPETPVYVKGDILYGLDITRQEIKKAGGCVIVEGEFDLLSSYKIGIGNIAAIKGSALTLNQLKLLKRYTQNLVLALDSDAAGDSASRRALALAENEGFNLKVAAVAGGKDPDDVARNNPVGWKETVRQAKPVYDFYLDSIFSRFDISKIEDKRLAAAEIISVLAGILNPIIQNHYLRQAARKLNVSEESILSSLKKLPADLKSAVNVSWIKPRPKPRAEMLEEYLLALMAQHPQTNRMIENATAILGSDWKYKSASAGKVINIIIRLKTILPDKIDPALPAHLKPVYDKAALTNLEGLLENPERLETETMRVLKELKKLHLKEQLRELSEKLEELLDTNGAEKAKKEMELISLELGRLSRI